MAHCSAFVHSNLYCQKEGKRCVKREETANSLSPFSPGSRIRRETWGWQGHAWQFKSRLSLQIERRTKPGSGVGRKRSRERALSGGMWGTNVGWSREVTQVLGGEPGCLSSPAEAHRGKTPGESPGEVCQMGGDAEQGQSRLHPVRQVPHGEV